MKTKTYLICFVSIEFLLVLANIGLSEQAYVDIREKLAPEVITAIEGNQATLNSICTIQATITSIRTSSFGAKGSRQIMKSENIWSDDTHFRKDIMKSQFSGSEREPLVLDKHKGYDVIFEPQPGGHINIQSIESDFVYDPRNQSVRIRNLKWDNKHKMSINNMLYYQSVKGYSLTESVLRNAKKGYYFKAEKDNLDGEDCLLLVADYVNSELMLKVWVVPGKGYCIKKMQNLYKGEVWNEYTTNLKQYLPNIWWFDTVRVKNYHTQISNEELSVDSIKINEPIAPEVFTISGTNIPSGTKIIDEIVGLRYFYGQPQVFGTETDLALDALEEDTIRDNTDSIGPKESNAPPTALVDEASPNKEELTSPGLMGQTDSAMDSTSRWPVLFIGMGIGVIVMLSVWFFYSKRKANQ